jgi:hypothetical protein
MIKKKTAGLLGAAGQTPRAWKVELTGEDHGLDSSKEQYIHGSEALATHDIHPPA